MLINVLHLVVLAMGCAPTVKCECLQKPRVCQSETLRVSWTK